MKTEVCYKFERKINNEIAAAMQFSFDNMVAAALDSFIKLNEAGQKVFNGSVSQTLKPAILVMEKMRFIYMCSIFEAFVKEYISYKSNVDIGEVKEKVLNKYNKEWKIYTDLHQTGTNSLLNLYYVNYIFENEYNFSFINEINDISKEIGILRNVLVHDDGIVQGKFIVLLHETLSYLDLLEHDEVRIEPNEKMMWIYVNDIRKIISICDEHS